MKKLGAVLGSLLVPVYFLVAGCASTSPPNAQIATSQPSPQIVNSALPTEGNGRIVFYRPNSLFGYAMRSDILLDGKVVGRSAPGTRFHVDVLPGVHKVTVPNSLYSGERALEVTLKVKEIVYVRTSLGGSAFGGRTNVEIVDGTTGMTESADLDVLDTSKDK